MLPSVIRRAKLEPLKILFRDKQIFVVDKPAGLVSQAGVDHERAAKGEATIEDHFYNLNTRLALAPDEWIRNVHRLDKSTTGPLILATTATKAKDLCAQFANRSVDKSYIAAVSRYLYPEERETEGVHVGFLESNDGLVSLSKKDKEGAKEVTTEWEWIGGDPNLDISLLRLRPKTGHKHQLRLFCSRYLSAPILGDTLYSFRSRSSPRAHPIHSAVRLRQDRIFLHCESIAFDRFVKLPSPLDDLTPSPGSGKRRKGGKAKKVRETVRAGMGRDWAEVLGKMKERKDEEDEVWKQVSEEEWEREFGEVEGGQGKEREVVDVKGGPRWELGTGGGEDAKKPEVRKEDPQ